MSIDRWIDKQNLVSVCNEILLNLKREGNSDTCYDMNKLWKHDVKWKETGTKEQMLYDSIYMRYIE